MNALERVRKNFRERYCQLSDEYSHGYEIALCDVQTELDKEVSCDWEAEIKQLNDKHRCEINELEESYKYSSKKYKDTINDLKQELITSRAKLEMVELIFGGK